MKTGSRCCLSLLIAISISAASLTAQSRNSLNNQILETVKKSTDYMINTVSYNGGFVWEYLPDFSRQWGEMEAYRTMVWTQGQGTPEMGEFFLDLYHATGDEYYYQAAEKAASALMWGQLPCGGWNYIIDFAGDASLKRWYETIGQNGWRLEEFQHYYGNATYDDDATISPARFLLRMYVEKYDPQYKAAIDKAINFVLESQYPIGGWPQRYPLMYEYSKNGRPDYSSFITFNDEVHDNNVRFLVLCYQQLGYKHLLDPIYRAMHCTLALQQGPDQPGWADQYSLDYRPAGARSYEPAGIQTRTTGWCLSDLLDYYAWTGDSKYLARIPEAIDWLEKVARNAADSLPERFRDLDKGRIATPRFIEIGGKRQVGSYRTGSNVVNGRYHTRYGYSNDFMIIDIDRIKQRYNELKAMTVEEAMAESPFRNEGGVQFGMSEYIALENVQTTEREVRELISSLTSDGYWLVPMTMTSNPYTAGASPDNITPGNFQSGQVGDKYDTSPFTPAEEVLGITTRSYMQNVSRLMSYLNN